MCLSEHAGDGMGSFCLSFRILVDAVFDGIAVTFLGAVLAGDFGFQSDIFVNLGISYWRI